MSHLMQCIFLFLPTRVNLHKNWPRNHTIKGGFLSTFSHHKISILNYKLSRKLLCIQGAQACKHAIIEGIPSIHQSCISFHRFSFFLLRRQRSWPSREDIYIQSSFFFSIQAYQAFIKPWSMIQENIDLLHKWRHPTFYIPTFNIHSCKYAFLWL